MLGCRLRRRRAAAFKTYRYGYRFLDLKRIGAGGIVLYGFAVKRPALYLESGSGRCRKGYGFILFYLITTTYFRFTYLCRKGAPTPSTLKVTLYLDVAVCTVGCLQAVKAIAASVKNAAMMSAAAPLKVCAFLSVLNFVI